MLPYLQVQVAYSLNRCCGYSADLWWLWCWIWCSCFWAGYPRSWTSL